MARRAEHEAAREDNSSSHERALLSFEACYRRQEDARGGSASPSPKRHTPPLASLDTPIPCLFHGCFCGGFRMASSAAHGRQPATRVRVCHAATPPQRPHHHAHRPPCHVGPQASGVQTPEGAPQSALVTSQHCKQEQRGRHEHQKTVEPTRFTTVDYPTECLIASKQHGHRVAAVSSLQPGQLLAIFPQQLFRSKGRHEPLSFDRVPGEQRPGPARTGCCSTYADYLPIPASPARTNRPNCGSGTSPERRYQRHYSHLALRRALTTLNTMEGTQRPGQGFAQQFESTSKH